VYCVQSAQVDPCVSLECLLRLIRWPQTAFDTASDYYEGLPVIELPDPPSQCNDFLKALYFPELVISDLRLTDNALTD
jgi:hypothetical protein